MAAHTVVGVQASLAPRRSRVAPELTRRGGAPRVRSASARLAVRAAKGDVLLEVKDLSAKVAETGEEILRGVTLTIKEGETHAIMG